MAVGAGETPRQTPRACSHVTRVTDCNALCQQNGREIPAADTALNRWWVIPFKRKGF